MNKETYHKVLDSIRFLGEIAYEEGYRIPKDRHNLRAYETVRDKKFWQTIEKYLLKELNK